MQSGASKSPEVMSDETALLVFDTIDMDPNWMLPSRAIAARKALLGGHMSRERAVTLYGEEAVKMADEQIANGVV